MSREGNLLKVDGTACAFLNRRTYRGTRRMDNRGSNHRNSEVEAGVFAALTVRFTYLAHAFRQKAEAAGAAFPDLAPLATENISERHQALIEDVLSLRCDTLDDATALSAFAAVVTVDRPLWRIVEDFLLDPEREQSYCAAALERVNKWFGEAQLQAFARERAV
jgi:hypothetical protein